MTNPMDFTAGDIIAGMTSDELAAWKGLRPYRKALPRPWRALCEDIVTRVLAQMRGEEPTMVIVDYGRQLIG